MGAKLHEIHGDGFDIKVAALICGEGIDFVLKAPGRKTVQLTCFEARRLAAALTAAAAESPNLTIAS